VGRGAPTGPEWIGTGGVVSPDAESLCSRVGAVDRVREITTRERSPSYQGWGVTPAASPHRLPGTLAMTHEPATSTRLAATRRKWHRLTLAGLGLLALIPLAFIASACWSPEPIRAGLVTIIGPNCRHAEPTIIRPMPTSAIVTYSWDSFRAPGQRRWLARGSGQIAGVYVEVVSATGTPLYVVPGKQFWSIGPFTFVLH